MGVNANSVSEADVAALAIRVRERAARVMGERKASDLADALGKVRMSKAAGLILIDSTPSDARVFINGVEVGRTPYVAPNTFQPGTEVPVRLTYPAAQDWNGTFPGGVDTSFSAELQAKSPP